MPRVTLHHLLASVAEAEVLGPTDVEVTSLCYDSRRAAPGCLFVAIPGFRTDGHRFLGQALGQGAAALVVQRDRRHLWGAEVPPGDVTTVVVADTRRALSALAAAFYGYPARHLRVVGVTGTDGKTSTSYITAAVLEAGGYRTGLITTVAFKVGERVLPNHIHQTTPEAPEVQSLLAQMVAAGSDYVVIESTSHGLSLHRLDHCYYDVGVFTNLSQDHLDFHGSREEYLAAKGRLFAMLGGAPPKEAFGAAVLNADDPASAYLAPLTKVPVITYGMAGPAQVRAEDVQAHARGTSFRLVTAAGEVTVSTSLIGGFNVYNCLAAAAVGLSQGITLEEVKRALEGFPGVPGRMEVVDGGQPFALVVDFAHAPNALRQALMTLRPLTPGRLVVLFGCAGERDPSRRRGMGLAAGQLADLVVLTSDDPRSEDPQAITEEIARGLTAAGREEGRDYVAILDRREAIAYACRLARPGDTVLLAGKGHEQTLLLHDQAIPWDDRQVARQVLAAL